MSILVAIVKFLIGTIFYFIVMQLVAYLMLGWWAPTIWIIMAVVMSPYFLFISVKLALGIDHKVDSIGKSSAKVGASGAAGYFIGRKIK